MTRREEWRSVLESEVSRLSALSYEDLMDALPDLECYTVERGSKTYQVEVQLLKETETFAQVSVSVDDGSLPASISPLCHSWIRHKEHLQPSPERV